VGCVDLGSVREPKRVLTSRKSLLAQGINGRDHAEVGRTPQKTFLKSPAVRVQTPRKTYMDSPSRIQRLISFTELDTDFDDENLNVGADEPAESPTERARPPKRAGLRQHTVSRKVQRLVASDSEEDGDWVQTTDYGGEGGFGEPLDFGEAEEEIVEESEQEGYQEHDELEAQYEEAESDELDELIPSPPIPKRSPGRPKPASTTTAKRSRAQKSSQPQTKRSRTTSTARIIERKERPQRIELSPSDGESIPYPSTH
jgi:hypothetical protein